MQVDWILVVEVELSNGVWRTLGALDTGTGILNLPAHFLRILLLTDVLAGILKTENTQGTN
jgi:hypothetical protein